MTRLTWFTSYDLPTDYTKLNPVERREVREQYVMEQEGKCYHCGGELSGPPAGAEAYRPVNTRLFPSGFFDHPIHLHHSHKSGMTIGAVHSVCNAILWQYHGE